MVASRSAPPASSRPAAPPKAALDALLSGTAGDPLRRALWLDELDRRLRPHFPSSLGAHARVANVDGTTLVFLVDSAIWHARMKLAAGPLLDVARSFGLDVTRVAVKTARPQARPAPSAGLAVKPMSAKSRDALRDALASLHPPLGATPGATPDVVSSGVGEPRFDAALTALEAASYPPNAHGKLIGR